MATRNRFWFGLCAMLASGCSGSSSDDGAEDGGSDADTEDGGGETFVISVLLGSDDSPLDNVTVALDLAGERTELTTDESGLVLFRGLHFGSETASVTAYRDGYGVVSYVGLEPSKAVLQVRTYRLTGSSGGSSATILGTAYNMISPDDSLIVTSTAGLDFATIVPPADYDLPVQSATDGTLVAIDYEGLSTGGPRDRTLDLKQWATKSYTGVAGVASVDIDFVDDAATPVAVSGSVVLPSRADSPLRTEGGGWFGVYSATATMLAGIYETSTLSTDRFDVVGQYVDLGAVFEPQTNYVLRVDAGNTILEQSIVTVFDYPTDGFEIANFLDAPEITSSLETHPIHDEITWINHGPSTLTTLRVFKWDDDVAIRTWDVYAPGAATSATIPVLPSTADPFDVLGDLPLSGRVGSCDLDEDLQFCMRQATSRTIELLP